MCPKISSGGFVLDDRVALTVEQQLTVARLIEEGREDEAKRYIDQVTHTQKQDKVKA